MTDNKALILAEFEKHKGQFVIGDDWQVMRLVAIGEDDMDYYYVLYDGRKLHWSTCVGRFVPLKGKIDEHYYEEYGRLIPPDTPCWDDIMEDLQKE